jgi:shikimate dehydrogenase
MINGSTEVIAHVGFPTHAFKAPMIYNPYFEQAGINAVVVPMGIHPEDYPVALRTLFRMSNIRGALVTMPHKITTVGLMDEITPTARVAGACNAVRRDADGRLIGDMFDGAGFVRGVLRKGLALRGARVLVVGSGGVGCAIAASLAAEGIAAIRLYDVQSPPRPRHWPAGCGSSTRRWRCIPGRTIRAAATWSSTRRRWA